MTRYTQNELFEAAQHLYNAYEYLQTDAGERDITWNSDLQESVDLLNEFGRKLTKLAVKTN